MREHLTEKRLYGDHLHGYLRVGNPLRGALWRDDQGEAERGDEKGDRKGGLNWGYVNWNHGVGVKTVCGTLRWGVLEPEKAVPPQGGIATMRRALRGLYRTTARLK